MATWGNEKYGVIGRGKAGWHAAAHNVSSSGGTLTGYLPDAADGALVYDADAADWDTFAALVIDGPMVDPGLPPGAVDRFADRDTARQMSGPGGLTGAFKAYAVKAQSAAYSGLDRIAVDLYEALLRTVPGIKIGHVRAGIVEWE